MTFSPCSLSLSFNFFFTPSSPSHFPSSPPCHTLCLTLASLANSKCYKSYWYKDETEVQERNHGHVFIPILPYIGGAKGGGAKHKYLLFDFAKYVSFLVQFAQWLLTSTLRIFKGKCRKLLESGWREITYHCLACVGGERGRDDCYKNPLSFISADAGIRKFLIGWAVMSFTYWRVSWHVSVWETNMTKASRKCVLLA